MEKRSHRRIPDLVAHTAFKGLDANEIGCVRTSIMAGSNSLRSKGRIQMRETSHLQIIKSSLQRTAGPYIWVMNDRIAVSSPCPLCIPLRPDLLRYSEHR